VDDSGDGPVDAGVVTDDQHAADQGHDGTGHPDAVAPAPASLAVADRSEQHRTPATGELPGKRAGALYEVFSHTGPTVFERYRRSGFPEAVEGLARADPAMA
jgi:hypothetical protein